MKFVTHMFMLGDTLHGIIRKHNKQGMTKEQVIEMKQLFNEKNGQVVPIVGQEFEIPQWEEHEIPSEPEPEIVEPEVVEEEPKGKIVLVNTKEEGDMFLRQERRVNARRERQGKPCKPASIIHIKGEKKVVTKPTPTPPKDAPTPKIVNTSDLPIRGLDVQEQEVLHRSLLSSVTIIDEGELIEPEAPTPPVETPVEVVDTTPAEPTNEERIAAKRKLARERRQAQLNRKK